MNSNRRWILIAIFTAALILRLAASFNAPVFYGGDDASYDQYAKSILEKHELYIFGHVSSFRPPLYIMFLAFIYNFFGVNHMLIKILQSLIGALTCIIIYELGRETISEKVGILSAAIAVFYVSLVLIPAHILTETIYTFLFTAAVLFLAKNERHSSFKWQALVGLSLGLASLTKGTPQLFPAFILLLMLLRAMKDKIPVKKIILQFTVICLFFLIPIIPWTIRNYGVHKGFVLVTTETGEAFYSAYHPPEGKRFGFSTVDQTKKRWEEINFRSEIEGSKFLVNENLKFIRENPLKVIKLTILKIAFMWSPFDWEILGGNGTYNFSYGFIIPFIIAGIIITIKYRIFYSLILYMPIIYSQGIGVAFDASPRYRLPIEPFLIIIASAGIIYVYERFIKHRMLVLGAMLGFLMINFAMFLFSDSIKAFARSGFHILGLW